MFSWFKVDFWEVSPRWQLRELIEDQLTWLIISSDSQIIIIIKKIRMLALPRRKSICCHRILRCRILDFFLNFFHNFVFSSVLRSTTLALIIIIKKTLQFSRTTGGQLKLTDTSSEISILVETSRRHTASSGEFERVRNQDVQHGKLQVWREV